MEIKQTTEYDKFHRIEGNRGINESLVIKIYKSIVEKDLLQYNPIIVNEEYGIIDGQHTLEAAKRAKKPIFYVIADSANIDDIISLNVNKKSWMLNDYIKSYAERGLGDYAILLGFMDKYDLSGTVSASLLLNRDVMRTNDRGSTTGEIKTGNFKVRDIKRAEKIATIMLKTSKYCASSFWRSREYVAALVRLVEMDLMDEMIRKLEIWSEHTQKLMTKKGTHRDYLRQFEDVLAYMSRTETKLY